jgi:predicted negative regulator of RcsB-dependent stress response
MPYIIAVVIIALAGVGFTFFKSHEAAPATTNTPAVTQVVGTHQYKDGSFSAENVYMTPKHTEYKIAVNLTLANSIVTEATVTGSQGAEVDPNAQRFMDAYKSEVIGKDINALNLSRVGGASLTTNAFNQALDTIKTQAMKS